MSDSRKYGALPPPSAHHQIGTPSEEVHAGPMGEDEWAKQELANTKQAALHFKERAEIAEASLARARKALELIEQRDRLWTSYRPKDKRDILEHASSGNMLVHGNAGLIARDALSSFSDEQGGEK